MNISHKNYPTVKSYVKMWTRVISIAKNTPNAKIDMGFDLGGVVTAVECRRKFYKALLNRIDIRGGLHIRGKKDSIDYFYSQWRDQQKIQDWYNNRIIIHEFETKECRKRFSQLIWSEE